MTKQPVRRRKRCESCAGLTHECQHCACCEACHLAGDACKAYRPGGAA